MPQPCDEPRVRELLLEAVEKPGPQRHGFLDEACRGEPDLREEVEALLSLLEQDESFPFDPAPLPALSLPREPATEAAGQQVGHYTLLRLIGEGGFGSVFLARQEQPVRREVALKIVKLGMDTRQVIARFRAEQQALAMMDHPHIARVYDAGVTGAGRPYFVMELVEGVPITQYADREKLDIRRRLELFVQVCRAVQHAHTKGIVHRDLKPSNVLVSRVDGQPVAKVIDFGIAKATQGRLTDQTLTGEARQWIGTPQYMSPEQAEGSTDIDTRSDIYMAGGLLYELLTGSTPFQADELEGKSLPDLQRMIRDVEPPPPSARLKASGAAVGAAAACRNTDPRRLRRIVRGELDWVVMKCVEKDRSRRYETTADLAADLERYLRNEPVTARQQGSLFRLRKLVRRNRLAFGAAAALLLVLLAGLGASTWSLGRARLAERHETDLRWDAEHRAYASDMAAIQQALAVNDIGRARTLLDGYRPGRGDKVNLRGWEWRYLWQQCRTDMRRELRQPSPLPVSCLSVSHDGRWLAVGQDDSGVSVWDLKTWREVDRPPAGQYPAQVAFSPTADLLAYTSVTFDAQGRGHAFVHLWDAASRTLDRTQRLNDYCNGLAFAPDGRTLLTSTCRERGELTFWSVPELAKRSVLKIPQSNDRDNVRFAAAPDLSAVAIVRGKDIRVIDASTGQERWGHDCSPQWPDAPAFSPDGRVLAFSVGVTDPLIYLYDVVKGTPLGPPLQGHLAWVGQLVFWPDGKTLASASADQTIRLWDVGDPAHGKPIGRPLRGDKEIWRLALLPDGKTLVSGAKYGRVGSWDSSDVRQEPAEHLHFPARAWSFEPAGAALVSVDPEGRVEQRLGQDLRAARTILELGGHTDEAWSARGRWLVGRCGDQPFSLDLATKERLPPGPSMDFRNLIAITPQGHWLGQGDPSTVREWDLRTGAELPSWHAPGGIVMAIASTPDGRRRLTLSWDGRGLLMDLSTGVQTPPFDLFDAQNVDAPRQFDSAAFSPDGSLVAAVGGWSFGVWKAGDLEKGGKVTPVAIVGGFTLAPHSVAFSPDGRRLAAGGDGREAVRLYDADSHLPVLTLAARGSIFQRTAFSPDGTVLAASNEEGELHLWRAPSWAEIEAAEGEGGG